MNLEAKVKLGQLQQLLNHWRQTGVEETHTDLRAIAWAISKINELNHSNVLLTQKLQQTQKLLGEQEYSLQLTRKALQQKERETQNVSRTSKQNRS